MAIGNISDLITKYNIDKKTEDAYAQIGKISFNVESLWFGLFSGKPNTQTYMNLSLLLRYLESNQNLFINEGENQYSFLKFNTNENNYCFTFPSQISSDPRICFIYNDAFPSLSLGKDFRTSNPTIGKIMYIMINIEYLSHILFDLKDNDGNVVLSSFLQRILNDINACLGNINKLTYKIFDNVITIIEEAPLNYGPLKSKKEYAKFNVYGVRPGEGSFVRNINFNVTIDKNLATMITVGAQANGNKLGVDSTSFSTFNKGLLDRIYTVKDTSPNDKSDINNLDKTELLNKFRKAAHDVYIISNNNQKGILNDETVATLSNLNSDFSKFYVGNIVTQNKVPAPVFFPFELNLDMIGLSGIIIFERFALTTGSEKILPSYYRDNNGKSLLNFIIFDIKHSIKSNQWNTTIRGRAIPSETDESPSVSINIDTDNYLKLNNTIKPDPIEYKPTEPTNQPSSKINKTLKQIIIDAGYPEGSAAHIFALSIGNKEGWNPNSNGGKGSRSYRNNNPGNLVYSSNLSSVDSGVRLENNPYGSNRFAAFSTPELGVKALIELKLKRWAKGKMPVTSGNTIQIEANNAGTKYVAGKPPTIAQFVYTYAPPSDGNNTERYLNGLLADISTIKPDTTRTTPLNNFF